MNEDDEWQSKQTLHERRWCRRRIVSRWNLTRERRDRKEAERCEKTALTKTGRKLDIWTQGLGTNGGGRREPDEELRHSREWKEKRRAGGPGQEDTSYGTFSTAPSQHQRPSQRAPLQRLEVVLQVADSAWERRGMAAMSRCGRPVGGRHTRWRRPQARESEECHERPRSAW
ncbi:hypothetical protein TgHK011_002716 [Trichoderma gracile]|nr:hypothetical protein TgHK011_002716 [Trichoderma gracile]